MGWDGWVVRYVGELAAAWCVRLGARDCIFAVRAVVGSMMNSAGVMEMINGMLQGSNHASLIKVESNVGKWE